MQHTNTVTPKNPQQSPLLIRATKLALLLSISQDSLRKLSLEPDFPTRIKISDRISAWRFSSIMEWIATKEEQAQGGDQL